MKTHSTNPGEFQLRENSPTASVAIEDSGSLSTGNGQVPHRENCVFESDLAVVMSKTSPPVNLPVVPNERDTMNNEERTQRERVCPHTEPPSTSEQVASTVQTMQAQTTSLTLTELDMEPPPQSMDDPITSGDVSTIDKEPPSSSAQTTDLNGMQPQERSFTLFPKFPAGTCF